jgi:hypothetical protein
MSRILKKYSHKYEFLKLELEEIQEQFEEYEIEWKSIFGKYFNNIQTEVWMNEETGEIRNTPPGQDEAKEKKYDKVKKLYRKASTKAHPDKGGNIDDFNDIKECYDNNDLLGLLSYASQNNIDFDVSDDDTEILDKSCLGLQNKITSLKSSLVWHFFTGDKRKKLGVILQLEQQYDVKIDQIEVLK